MKENVYCLFIDDSRQKKTCLSELGPLIGVGGLVVDVLHVNEINHRIKETASKYGLPKSCEIKWSPDKNNWMHKNLIEDKRQSFFLELITIIREYECTIFATIEDTNYRPCNGKTHEESVISMLFERYERFLQRNDSSGLIVMDSPSGDKKDEEDFLTKTMDKIEAGTKYVDYKHFVMNVFTSSSKINKLIQIADLIVGSTLSRIAHDHELAKTIFDSFKCLFDHDGSTFGGIGLKIHPGVRHRNLYKWIMDDNLFYEGSGNYSELPNKKTPYYNYPYRI